jgi:hypothetical protein
MRTIDAEEMDPTLLAIRFCVNGRRMRRLYGHITLTVRLESAPLRSPGMSLDCRLGEHALRRIAF